MVIYYVYISNICKLSPLALQLVEYLTGVGIPREPRMGAKGILLDQMLALRSYSMPKAPGPHLSGTLVNDDVRFSGNQSDSLVSM